jgi:tetratricopeptide (TPR) repeat protein
MSRTTKRQDDETTLRLTAWLVAFGMSLSGMTQAADGRGRAAIDVGAPEMNPVLIRYYKSFLESQDVDAFVQSVLGRYNEGTLIRLLDSSDAESRRAAVLALGLIGGTNANTAVGERMKDADPVVRSFAENALWGIWFRSDSPANNAELSAIRNLMSEERPNEAFDRVNQLIDKSPGFAEAWNQRAIIHFSRGDWDKSAQDCARAVELNPYHYGALSGMAQCQLKSGLTKEALETFRKLVRIQPHNTAVQAAIDSLQRGDFKP